MRQLIYYRISRPVFYFLIFILTTSFLIFYFIKNSETALGATGTLTVSGCTIPDGSSSCRGSVSWRVTDPVSPSLRQGSAVISIDASRENMAVELSYGTTYFYLYDGPSFLNLVEVGTTCSNTSYWDSATCRPRPSATISASACSIPVNSSSCNSTVTWSTSNLVGTASVRQGGAHFSSDSSGTQAKTIYYGTTNFSVYDNSSFLSSANGSADCVGGTRWSALDNACIKVRDLESSGLPTHKSGALVLNSTASFGGIVKNVGTENVGSFSDKFTYCWGSSCTPSLLMGDVITHGGLTAGSSAADTASITFGDYGTLRVMHCVNTAGDFTEGRVW